MSGLQTLLTNSYGPAIGALCFVLIMSRVPEPMRRSLNAVLVAGTCGAYLNGGFGIWELIYPVLATPVVYFALRSYPFIGVACLMHAAWDLPHHLWGNPIWPFMPTSSWGCLIFDSSSQSGSWPRRTRADRTWSSGAEGARESHSAVTRAFQTTACRFANVIGFAEDVGELDTILPVFSMSAWRLIRPECRANSHNAVWGRSNRVKYR